MLIDTTTTLTSSAKSSKTLLGAFNFLNEITSIRSGTTSAAVGPKPPKWANPLPTIIKLRRSGRGAISELVTGSEGLSSATKTTGGVRLHGEFRSIPEIIGFWRESVETNLKESSPYSWFESLTNLKESSLIWFESLETNLKLQ